MDGSEQDQIAEHAWDAGSWPQRVRVGESSWRPAAGYGRLVGAILIFCLAVIAMLSLLLLVRDEGAVRIVWLIVLGGSLAAIGGVVYLLRGLATLRYVLMDDHLRIEWRRSTRRMPYEDMLQVTYDVRDQIELPYREPYWPGYRISTIRTRDGIWHSYATVPPRRRVRITTPVAVFAISPERPVLFIQELERRRFGQSVAVSAGVAIGQPKRVPRRQPGLKAGVLEPARESIDIFRNELLTDRIASTLVAVGIIIPVFLLAYTFNEVDFLPDQIPLRWDAQGDPVRVGPSSSIWILPLVALTVLVINAALATLVLRFDRVAARLLVLITPLVQIAVGLALWRIIN
jgi:hypothetical protein